MKPAPLWKVWVVTTVAAEESVTEVLTARLGAPASSYTDLKTGKTTVTVYLKKKPALSVALEQELGAALEALNARGERRGVRLKIARVKPEDWTKSWKRHFKPLEISEALLIRPSWSRRKPRRGQAVVTLDPGMSFGTGQHPTTSFCLRELERLRKFEREQSFLDVGTGSGILAICAAKLGYRPVDALDVDPESIKIARVNAKNNGVGGRIKFRCQDFSREGKSSKRYSVVCANLIANLILSEKDSLIARIQTGGRLVVAGILKEEFEKIRRSFEKTGIRLERSQAEGEWRSGTFAQVAG